jgi:hypothetical protein
VQGVLLIKKAAAGPRPGSLIDADRCDSVPLAMLILGGGRP